MKAISNKSHPLVNVGNNVTILISYVDRGKGEMMRNIIGIVLETNDLVQTNNAIGI